MTEDEATNRWCPFARSRLIEWRKASDETSNQIYCGPRGHEAPTTLCLGSACMAWRWHPAKQTAAYLAAVQERMQKQAKPNFNTATQEVYAERANEFARTEGYCGIAGVPQ